MKKLRSRVLRKISLKGGRIFLMKRDDEISVAEDDQEDMSVDNCDCKLLEFLFYFVRTDCLGVVGFRTAT